MLVVTAYSCMRWIPASAGMTREGCRDSSLLRVWGYPPTQFSPQEWGRREAERICREPEGVPRFFSLLIPQEWGTKGVENNRICRTPQKQDTRAIVLSVPPWGG